MGPVPCPEAKKTVNSLPTAACVSGCHQLASSSLAQNRCLSMPSRLALLLHADPLARLVLTILAGPGQAQPGAFQLVSTDVLTEVPAPTRLGESLGLHPHRHTWHPEPRTQREPPAQPRWPFKTAGACTSPRPTTPPRFYGNTSYWQLAPSASLVLKWGLGS